MIVASDLPSFDKSNVFSKHGLDDVDVAKAEKTLNVMGYFPILRDFSGILRIGIGVASLARHVSHLISYVNSQKEWNFSKGEVRRDLIDIAHAVTNIGRGAIESCIISIPLINWIAPMLNWIAPTFRIRSYVIVSFLIIPIIYDIAGLRFKYPGEIKAEN